MKKYFQLHDIKHINFKEVGGFVARDPFTIRDVDIYIRTDFRFSLDNWKIFYNACIKDIQNHQPRPVLKKIKPVSNTRRVITSTNFNSKTKKINYFKVGTIVGAFGLSALYYNRNHLTKSLLKTYFKADIKKYKKYKKEHIQEEKPITFKQWYYKEYKQSKKTHKRYFNYILDKMEHLQFDK